MRRPYLQILGLIFILIVPVFGLIILGFGFLPSSWNALPYLWEPSISALPLLIIVLLLVSPVVLLALLCLESQESIDSQGELEQLVQAKQQGKLILPAPRQRPTTKTTSLDASLRPVADSEAVLDRLLRLKRDWNITA